MLLTLKLKNNAACKISLELKPLDVNNVGITRGEAYLI